MITIADLRQLPPSRQLFDLIAREFPIEERQRQRRNSKRRQTRYRRSRQSEISEITRWHAEWLLEQIEPDPPHVTAFRRAQLEAELKRHDQEARGA